MKEIRPKSARLARVVAVAGAAALLAAAIGAPASARAEVTIEPFFRNVTIPTTGPGLVDRVTLFASEPVELDNVVFTIDFSAIAGFATVAEHEAGSDPDCTVPAANVLTCEVPVPITLNPATSLIPEIVISATGSATEGDEGVLVVTAEADGFAPVSHEARVRVGTGVNLAASPSEEREAEVGESFAHVVTVTNTGDTEVHGVGLAIFSDRAFRAGEEFSNCTYIGDSPRICHFDQVLSPGLAYQAHLPFVVGVDTFAPSGQGAEFQWLTSAELEDLLDLHTSLGGDVGLPGTGGVLELIEVDPFSAANVEADTDPTNNWSALFLSVTGQNRTDLAAIGDTITGAEGDEVAAVIGIGNNGPATIDRSRVGASAAVVHVAVPPGTTAIEVPSTCQPQTENGQIVGSPGDPGQARYICAGTAMILPAGETVTFEFTLRIDDVVPDAAGTVEILRPCPCDALSPEVDVDHSNNIAKILVNPTEPELPDTGNRVGLIAALGALLLLLGTTAVVLALRRRQPAAK